MSKPLAPKHGGSQLPRCFEQFENRDTRSRFLAYVPPGSIERGVALAAGIPGNTDRCAICHGADLKGLAAIRFLRPAIEHGFASLPRPARLSDIQSQSVEPASSPASGAMGCALAKRCSRVEKIASQELDHSEVVPDSVDRAVDGGAAFEIGERAIEFTHGQISMPAPSQEQRIVRLDLQTCA